MTTEKVDYFSVDAISNSSINRFLVHPRLFRMDKTSAPKRHFTLGSVVDCLITEEDKFDELIEIADYKKPSGGKTKIGSLMESLIISTKEGKEFEEALDIAIEVADYAKKTREQVLADFEEYRKYFEAVTSSSGKIILTPKELKLAKEIKTNLMRDQRCSKWLIADSDEEIIFQKEVYWKCSGLDCKSKLDSLKINHKTKEVAITDIKTMSGETFNFNESIIRNNYLRQASFYSAAVTTLPEYKDFKHLKFNFVVESTTHPGFPMCYTVSEKDLLVGAIGGVVNGKKYKGFKESLSDIKWHQDNDLWDYSRDYYERGFCETNLSD